MPEPNAAAVKMYVRGKLKNPLNGSHRHWSVKAKERARWREMILAAWKEMGQPTMAPGPKRVHFHAFTWNEMDTDGLVASLKPCRDALVDARLISDDSPRAGNRFTYDQEIRRKLRGVEITVEPR